MKRKRTKKAKRTAKVSAQSMETVLVLRTCHEDMTAHGGFQWPTSGECVAPDWKKKPVCGYGLHGLLWGEGDGSLFDWSPDAKWLVVEVAADSIVSLGQKVKFPKGNVVFCGDRLRATAFLAERAKGRAIVGGTATAGDRGTATAGYRGTATAGYGGTATAGVGGTATAGDGGAATAGVGGTATAGDRGTATAGYGGTATAGDRGTVCLRWWDDKASRQRIITAYPGENGIKPNVKYRLDEKGNVVEAN